MNGHGTTEHLCRLVPNLRILERIHIARGFTPWQHYSLLDALPELISEETSLVVLPEFGRFYRMDDLRRGEGKRMLSEVVTRLTEILDIVDLPILVTLSNRDEFSEPVLDVVSETLDCELTKYGPRFAGNSFETLVYPLENGMVQTTISFWNHILAARHPRVNASTTTPEVIALGAN